MLGFRTHRAPLLAAALGTVLLAGSAGGQTADDSVARRFRFAETYVGGDLSLLPAGDARGGVPLPGRAAPRLAIGGLHFWGHADFAVAFPVAPIARTSGGLKSTLTSGIETRARWFPRSLERNGISPYIGTAFASYNLRVGNGPNLQTFRPQLQAGIGWRHGRTLVDAGWSVRPNNTFRYPLSRTTFGVAEPSAHQVWLGVNRLFETTRPLEPLVRSGAWDRQVTTLRQQHRVSGPTIALGPTAIFLTGATTYNTSARPFLAPRARTSLTLDAGLGWYFDPTDVQVNLAWRRGTFRTKAYDFTQSNTRNAFTLEAFHFVGDYYGFAPFVGPALSVERLGVTERDRGTTVTDASRSLVAPGITFGWDIRPVRAQRVVLRTNLRWFPRLRIDTPAGRQSLDQLEFNFIQVVWHPRR